MKVRKVIFLRKVECSYTVGEYIPFVFFCKKKATANFIKHLWETDPHRTSRPRHTRIIKLRTTHLERLDKLIPVELYRDGALVKLLRVTANYREGVRLSEWWSNRSYKNLSVVFERKLFWEYKTIVRKLKY